MIEKQSSFPCLICGKELSRSSDYEAQPNDGVMCQSNGNYGSTVFDDFVGEVIRFNICDRCFTKAGEDGRLFVSRERVPIYREDEKWGRTLVGWKQVYDRPFVPWHAGITKTPDEWIWEDEQ